MHIHANVNAGKCHTVWWPTDAPQAFSKPAAQQQPPTPPRSVAWACAPSAFLWKLFPAYDWDQLGSTTQEDLPPIGHSCYHPPPRPITDEGVWPLCPWLHLSGVICLQQYLITALKHVRHPRLTQCLASVILPLHGSIPPSQAFSYGWQHHHPVRL